MSTSFPPLANALTHHPWPNFGQDTLLELCLIMPARLSDMLAVLTWLMAPLLEALRASDELVQLALRTLEYWVDR